MITNSLESFLVPYLFSSCRISEVVYDRFCEMCLHVLINGSSKIFLSGHPTNAVTLCCRVATLTSIINLARKRQMRATTGPI